MWAAITRWLHISTALHNSVIPNFQQFVGLCGTGRMKTEKLMVIWYALYMGNLERA